MDYFSIFLSQVVIYLNFSIENEGGSRRSNIPFDDWEVGKHDEISVFKCLFLQKFSLFW